MAQRYIPPRQGVFGQYIDVALLLIFVFAALFVPVRPELQPQWLTDYLSQVAVGRAEKLPEGVTYTTATDATTQAVTKTWTGLTWESLGQNATMQKQWEKLGYTPESAADIITQPFNYAIDISGLLLTIVVIVGYYGFVLWASKKEYREVIREKFE
jgi:GNAT superfamily N-acetyltransferase